MLDSFFFFLHVLKLEIETYKIVSFRSIEKFDEIFNVA